MSVRTLRPIVLRRIFPADLKRQSADALTPLLNLIFERFIAKIKEKAVVGISDITVFNNSSLSPSAPIYVAVVENKLVFIELDENEEETRNEDATWWMSRNIRVKGNQEAVRKFLDIFSDFVQKQDLRSLHSQIVRECESSWVKNWGMGMRRFVFELPPHRHCQN